MDIWFTSDTHFGHNNIIKYCNRPFSSVEEMDAAIIENWNKEVKPTDLIYHLGDFTFYKDPEKIKTIFNQLNGQKRIIFGNHDNVQVLGNLFKGGEFYKELRGITKLPIILMHFPIESWDRKFHKSIHIHGHAHGTVDNTLLRRYDAGVDCWNMRPVHIDTILELSGGLVPKGVPELPKIDPDMVTQPRDSKFEELYVRASNDTSND
jgi:calcineurin-like phosphoesterase family protein